MTYEAFIKGFNRGQRSKEGLINISDINQEYPEFTYKECVAYQQGIIDGSENDYFRYNLSRALRWNLDPFSIYGNSWVSIMEDPDWSPRHGSDYY